MPPPPALVQQLVALGIPKERAAFALSEHANDVEAAADWSFTEGAEWTPQDLLGTTFSRPPQGFDEPDSSSIPRRGDAPRGSHAGARVPPWRALEPGTKVHIVLKEDQGTGRTVEGEVQDRLTKGDHPRGVKVRLRDGRVGRVARLA